MGSLAGLQKCRGDLIRCGVFLVPVDGIGCQKNGNDENEEGKGRAFHHRFGEPDLSSDSHSNIGVLLCQDLDYAEAGNCI